MKNTSRNYKLKVSSTLILIRGKLAGNYQIKSEFLTKMSQLMNFRKISNDSFPILYELYSLHLSFYYSYL